jgi:predicted enzyme related to lactoylglutathione lyase
MSSFRKAASGVGAGGLCWVDLATSDTAAAAAFYRGLFGWSATERHVGRGRFSTFARGGEAFASLYQLTRAQIAAGVPSHWLPYVSVRNVDAAAAQAAALGGELIVPPQDVPEIARICLVADPTGAFIGLWQAEPPGGHARNGSNTP